MNTELEERIMALIMNGGDGRSFFIKAVEAASREEFDLAKNYMTSGKAALNRAHDVQTKLIQAEIRGEGSELKLLMVHAQDHVMNAMTVRDLGESLIRLHQLVADLKKRKEE
ncbi:MAG: PTS lactose/cellobiose transporter subunit IIA [Vagococcus salmoninarum]|uniref:PTS lactose/cellobiose transporter subunit IIA n=1 Tax=Vagococcus salmoninarum TaxID=2739 RepID=UPI003F95B066